MMPLPSDLRLAQHPWHAFFFSVFALYVYGALIFLFAAAIFPDLAELFQANDPAAIEQLWLIQAFLFFAIFAYMSLWCERVGAGPFAVPIQTDWKWAVGAIIGGPIIYVTLLRFSYTVIAGGAEDWAYADTGIQDIMENSAASAAMIVAVVVIGPIFEEMAYRGIAMGALLGRGVPTAAAIIIPAILFAISHTQYTPAALFAVFMFGIFLGILRLKSRSIAPPILAHMSVNWFLTVGVG